MKTNIELLQELVEKSKTGFMKTLCGKKYKFLRDWIDEQTPKLADPKFNLKTKIYWVLNSLTDFPKCEVCGNDITSNVTHISTGYEVKTCCKACKYKHASETTQKTCLEKYGVRSVMMLPAVREASKRTCLERYGVENTGQIPGAIKKREETCLKKYGVKSPMQLPSVIEKSKRTQLERYGATSFTKTQAFIDKTNATCMEKYGTMFPGQSESAKLAHKKTCLEKYGVDSYAKTEEFAEKTKRTCLNRYGVENVWQSGAEGREKAKQTRKDRYGDENYNNRAKAAETCRKQYGVSTPCESPEIRRMMATSYMKTSYRTLCGNAHVVPMFSENEYLAKTQDTVFKWKCLDCGNEFETKINWNYYKDHSLKTVARCLNCMPVGMSGSSEEERTFINAIKSIYKGAILERQSILETGNDKRFWKEIDCYLPDIKVGFEYDGLYFHQLSSYEDDSHRHIEKTKLAEKQGIILVHVRSDEWLADSSALTDVYKNIINGTPDINTGSDIITVDRSVYNKCVHIPGYELIGETTPEKFEIEYNNKSYIYEDCGELIYKKKNA